MTDIVHDLRTHARGQQTGSIDRTNALMMRAADLIESLRDELSNLDADGAGRPAMGHCKERSIAGCKSCGTSRKA